MPLCEVCEERAAVATCRICGRHVCGKHISNGICSVCQDLMCQVCGERLSIDVCPFCGRLICRECSVELQPGIRVCKECFPKIPELLRKYPQLTHYRRLLPPRTPLKT